MLVFSLIFWLFTAHTQVVKEYSYNDTAGKHRISFQLVNVMDTMFEPGAPSYIRMLYTNDKYAKQQQVLLHDSCKYEMTQIQFYPTSIHIVDLDKNGTKEFVFVYGIAGHLYEEIPMWYCVLANGKLYKASLTKKYTDEAGAEVMLTSEDEFKRSLPAMFQAAAVKEYLRIKAACIMKD